MIKIVLLCIFVILAWYCPAQDYERNSQRRFSVGLSFSPDYTNRKMISHDERFDGNDFDDNSISEGRFGYTTGLSCKYLFAKGFALESGLLFSDRGDKIEMDSDDWVSPDDILDPGFSSNDPLLPDWMKTKYHYYYLGIPLKLDFYLVDKKTKVFFTGGISTDFYISSKTKMKYELEGIVHEEKYKHERENYKKVNFVGLAGLGIEYPISKQFHCRFEPLLRYSFSRSTKKGDLDIAAHLYSVGVNFAVYFQK